MKVPTTIHFDRPLYLDRKRGKYSFTSNADSVEVVAAGDTTDVEALFNPFTHVKLESSWEMFEDEVAEALRVTAETPTTAAASAPKSPAASGTVAAAEISDASAAAKPSSPSEFARGRLAIQAKFSKWKRDPAARRALFGGSFDREIRQGIVGFCQALGPTRVLRRIQSAKVK